MLGSVVNGKATSHYIYTSNGFHLIHVTSFNDVIKYTVQVIEELYNLQGELREQSFVNPTMSGKKMVTDSKCSGSTDPPAMSCSPMKLGTIVDRSLSTFLFSAISWLVLSSTTSYR